MTVRRARYRVVARCLPPSSGRGAQSVKGTAAQSALVLEWSKKINKESSGITDEIKMRILFSFLKIGF